MERLSMRRDLGTCLCLWLCLWFGLCFVGADADAAATASKRDPDLDQLRTIQLPHIFVPLETSLINHQLDVLKLGIDLFLAQERQLGPNEQQRAYNNLWPLLACIFRKDFESSTPSTPPAQTAPDPPAQPDAQPGVSV